jgi:hypothetical protein
MAATKMATVYLNRLGKITQAYAPRGESLQRRRRGLLRKIGASTDIERDPTCRDISAITDVLAIVPWLICGRARVQHPGN